LLYFGPPAPAQNTDWQPAVSWIGKNPLEQENARREPRFSSQLPRRDSFSCPERGISFEMDRIKDQLD
jgi:hypothetical protein